MHTFKARKSVCIIEGISERPLGERMGKEGEGRRKRGNMEGKESSTNERSNVVFKAIRLGN